MTFVSYSQNFEDVLLWRSFSQLKTGFYIDVGASHPDVDSVTRAFYDRGWRGINIEPTAAAFVRLTASRPRDINLNVAIGDAAGRQRFYAIDGAGSGLSTFATGAAEAIRAQATEVSVEVDTLAAVCDRFAPAEIHFLKIDVEGAERLVLEGADFARYRPWILLIEATAPMSTTTTHAGWEPIVVDAGYRFVWFDGLNRFYVADEHHAALAPHFLTPPNVFDDFLRAADTEWTRRLAEAEQRADVLLHRALAAENRAFAAQELSELAHLRSIRSEVDAARAEERLDRSDGDRARLRSEIEHAGARQAELLVDISRSERGRMQAEQWLEAMRRSTTWRAMGPVRRVLRVLGRDQSGVAPQAIQALAPVQDATPLTAPPSVREAGTPTAVHQFHSGTATGDAITNSMLLIRSILRRKGYRSHIFAEHRAAGLDREIMPFSSLPSDNDYALIVHHSMGHDLLAEVLATPVRKLLAYHNITPSELLDGSPHLQAYADKGRRQLTELRAQIGVAIADSEFNGSELTAAGFDDVTSCPLLFDLERLRSRALAPSRGKVFTILFVGRLARSKGQLDLLTAFARFRELYRGQSRLILVGRNYEDSYTSELFERIRLLRLNIGEVELTGLVSDEALRGWYAAADLFVSLSRHEGFGVPLIEAIAAGLPVMALASGAMPEVLGDPAALLQDERPSEVALRLLEIADDDAARERMAVRQRQHVERYRLDHHVPALLDALRRIGVRQPPDGERSRAVSASMQVTIAGHLSGSYSLAEVNRALAFALDDARPGTVRLIPVEGEPRPTLTGVPEAQRARLRQLVGRPPPLTRPHVLISQHYPVWVPAERGDLCLASFFWEESLVPAHTVETLNAHFDGVLAPTRSVAKALIDSGVTKPVRTFGHAPRLDAFQGLRARRSATAPTGPFTFLHVSSAFPRKGIDVLLSAYAKAFRRSDDVRLVIKCFPNPHNTARTLIDSLQSSDPDAPAIELIDRDIDPDEMLALFEAADAMVLPTRGEGFNLPAAEALAAGLPLIVTGHGGHLDFVGRGCEHSVRLLRYALAPARTHLSPPFSLWAEPDESDLVAALHESRSAGRRMPAGIPWEQPDLADRLSRITNDLLHRRPPALSVAMMTTWDVRCGVAEYARHLVAELPAVRTILSDRRSEATGGDPAVVPCWSSGATDQLGDVAAGIVQANPEALVIQHQPGLLPWTCLEPLLTCDALQGRVVCLTLHNTRHLLHIEDEVRRSALRALAMASRVIVHTLDDVNRLLQLGLRDNVLMIPHGIAGNASGLARVLRDVSTDDTVRIGCYGFFLPGKGIDRLIEALPHIREHFPLARLRLVNAAYPDPRSTEEIARCREIARRLGEDEAIEFEIGFLPEARSTELLRACDVIALPYEHSDEASSAAMRSVMCAGVPIAVTPIPLFDEADGAVERLPGSTSVEIAAGIVGLLQDQQRRVALARAAEEWRADRLWPEVARRWDGVLRALLASGVVVGRDDGPDPVR